MRERVVDEVAELEGDRAVPARGGAEAPPAEVIDGEGPARGVLRVGAGGGAAGPLQRGRVERVGLRGGDAGRGGEAELERGARGEGDGLVVPGGVDLEGVPDGGERRVRVVEGERDDREPAAEGEVDRHVSVDQGAAFVDEGAGRDHEAEAVGDHVAAVVGDDRGGRDAVGEDDPRAALDVVGLGAEVDAEDRGRAAGRADPGDEVGVEEVEQEQAAGAVGDEAALAELDVGAGDRGAARVDDLEQQAVGGGGLVGLLVGDIGRGEPGRVGQAAVTAGDEDEGQGDRAGHGELLGGLGWARARAQGCQRSATARAVPGMPLGMTWLAKLSGSLRKEPPTRTWPRLS